METTKTLGKPQSNSDVLNKQPKTLLIGYGWVGQFVHKYFTQADWYTPNAGLNRPSGQQYLDDKPGQINTRKMSDDEITEASWDLAFIGTPSPMNDDGSCDVSYVESAVKQWHDKVKLFIIRSTVTPGTTDRLQKEYPENLFVMSPEYVGETLAHPLTEPSRETFIILGGSKEATKLAAYHWSKVLHSNSTIRQLTALEAEFCKYMENCYLATKVIFVNDWLRLCDKVGVDFLALREAWLDDPRIGRSHTFPYRENPGFSGKCLPKDLNSIAHWAREVAGEPLVLVEALLVINAAMRKGIKGTVPLMPKTGPLGEINDNIQQQSE